MDGWTPEDAFITKTRPYNIQFFIAVKLEFSFDFSLHFFFIFLLKTYCGYRLEPPH